MTVAAVGDTSLTAIRPPVSLSVSSVGLAYTHTHTLARSLFALSHSFGVEELYDRSVKPVMPECIITLCFKSSHFLGR